MSDIEQGLKEAVEAARSGALGQNIVRHRTGKDFPDAPPEGDAASRGRAHNARVEPGHIVRDAPAYAGARVGNGSGVQHMTAPQLIDHIDTLTKSAAVLEGLTFDLSNELAGHTDYAGAKDVASSGQGLEMTVFDRMGVRLLELTRTIESIEREVKRSLGAVKP